LEAFRDKHKKNVLLVDYICFEELVVSADSLVKFVPGIQNDPEYTLLRQHLKTYDLGNSTELRLTLLANGYKVSTTERVYADFLERIFLVSQSKIGNENYDIVRQHYIYKGRWSQCWKMDCTDSCPNDKCWEATREAVCSNCTSRFKGDISKCRMVLENKMKIAEVQKCDRSLPSTLGERIKLLFNIPKIEEIDNFPKTSAEKESTN
jgi:hypothetical protein